MEHTVRLLASGFVTHDVKRLVLSRPDGFSFTPGQGVELALDEAGWREEGRPFTPTSLPADKVLELTVKGYPEHHGVTERLHRLEPGAVLHMSEPFGTISDQGPGVFVAGGAGVTPFLSILRHRASQRTLDGYSMIFSNKTGDDVIYVLELRHALGERCHLVLTRDEAPGRPRRRIDRELLAEVVDDFAQKFYVCGPESFVASVKTALGELGASPDAVVFEE